MKIMTILGTRPEIIRLSRTIRFLDSLSDHILVHTGQNYDDRLSRIFFEDLGLRPPNVYLGVRAETFGGQIGQILERAEKLFLDVRPERLLILGDTNSGLAAIIAKRLGIAVYHMEAGNRCYDDRVPEETNRRIIDQCSNILMPYTHRSKENLVSEGFSRERIFVVGNPIKEVIDEHQGRIMDSKILGDLNLREGMYSLVTLHRAENVDSKARLGNILKGLARVYEDTGFPIVYSFHPHTRERIEQFGINLSGIGLEVREPFGFFDFVRLEKSAYCILTDSGTVQEEACIFGVPNVTIRDVTERPETIECGSNILTGEDPENIVTAVKIAIKNRGGWTPPQEYLATNVAESCGRIVLGYRQSSPSEEEWLKHARS